MLKKILLLFVLVTSNDSVAQVGIGTQSPAPSSLLELSSSNKGFLPPRMSQLEYNAIPNPAEGLVVYCNDCLQKGLRLFNGTSWEDMAGNGIPTNSISPLVTTSVNSYAIGSQVTFTATTGTWSGTALVYLYQWFFNGTAISGATGSTLTTNVAAGNYYCTVISQNVVGNSQAVVSNSIVVYAVAPINSVAPIVTQSNMLLSCSTGTWSSTTSSFTYQWFKNNTPISGANNATYTIQAIDFGATLKCEVTTSNNIGLSTAASNEIVIPLAFTSGGAYSLRKVMNNATFAIKVRRSSDNTTQDIGFVGNDLDTAALTTFIGSGNGFIDTWYDQSTNARHITQATTANQPQIVAAGAVLVRNGKPVVRFNGTSHVLSNASPWMYDNGAITALAVAIGNTSFNTVLLSETNNTNNNQVYAPMTTGASNALTVFVRGNSGTPLLWSSIQTGVFNNNYKSVSIQDNGSSFIATNGATVSSPFTYSRTTNIGVMDPRNRFNMGAWVRTTNGNWWSGDISEMIIYPTVLVDAARDLIKANQSNYYGL
jgi:hypothetical protein